MADIIIGSGSDTIKLYLSETAYQGDAIATVAVDDGPSSDPFTVAALHGQATQAVVINGAFGQSAHTVAVTFANDAYGGSADTDRNLYVDGLVYNGAAVPGATATLLANGTTTLIIPANLVPTAAEMAAALEAQFDADLQAFRAAEEQKLHARLAALVAAGPGQAPVVPPDPTPTPTPDPTPTPTPVTPPGDPQPPLGTTAPVIDPPTIPVGTAPADRFSDGIYGFPKTIYFSSRNGSAGGTGVFAGGVVRITSGLPWDITMSGPVTANHGYLAGRTRCGFGLSDTPPAGTYAGRVTASDKAYGGATELVHDFELVVQPNAVALSTGVILRTDPVSYYGQNLQAAGLTQGNAHGANGCEQLVRVDWAGGKVVFTDPTGMIGLDRHYTDDLGSGLLVNTDAAIPFEQHYGVSPCTFTLPDGSVVALDVYRMDETPAGCTFVPAAQTTYDYLDAGDQLGQVVASAMPGVASISLVTANQPIFITPIGGVKAAGALTAGELRFTARVTSNNGQTTDHVLTRAIAASNRLPEGNMTLTVPTDLDNYRFQQVVGTPKVAGISGTPQWSMTNQDDGY